MNLCILRAAHEFKTRPKSNKKTYCYAPLYSCRRKLKKCLLLVDGVGDQHGRQHREKSLSLSIGGGLLAVAGKGEETSTLLAMVLLPLLQQLTQPQTFFLVRAFVLSEGGRLAQTWLLRQSQERGNSFCCSPPLSLQRCWGKGNNLKKFALLMCPQ